MRAVFTCLLAEPLIVFSRNMERTRGSGRLTLCCFALVLMALIKGLQASGKSKCMANGCEYKWRMTLVLYDILQTGPPGNSYIV